MEVHHSVDGLLGGNFLREFMVTDRLPATACCTCSATRRRRSPTSSSASVSSWASRTARTATRIGASTRAPTRRRKQLSVGDEIVSVDGVALDDAGSAGRRRLAERHGRHDQDDRARERAHAGLANTTVTVRVDDLVPRPRLSATLAFDRHARFANVAGPKMAATLVLVGVGTGDCASAPAGARVRSGTPRAGDGRRRRGRRRPGRGRGDRRGAPRARDLRRHGGRVPARPRDRGASARSRSRASCAWPRRPRCAATVTCPNRSRHAPPTSATLSAALAACGRREAPRAVAGRRLSDRRDAIRDAGAPAGARHRRRAGEPGGVRGRARGGRRRHRRRDRGAGDREPRRAARPPGMARAPRRRVARRVPPRVVVRPANADGMTESARRA